MNRFRIAIIGTGYIAHYHARALQLLPDVEIAIVVDNQLDKANKFAEIYKTKEIATDAMALVDRPDINAVLILTPNKFHAPYTIEFLSRGKDVFLEKPMAMNASEGDQIIEVSNRNGQLVMVGHMWRFDAEVDYIKKVVDSGRLGKIVKTKGYGIHENWGPSGWFTQKELAGGGALADMGVHAIDTVRYILGDPKPLSVYAAIDTQYGNYDVDDNGIVIISWDNGVHSIIESGWWHPHMDGVEAATRLFGTKGYGSVFPTCYKADEGKTKEEYKPQGPLKSEHCDQSIYNRQMEYFIECIRTRKQPSPGLKEGQTVLNIVDAAYLSAKKNELIRL
ncbi:MAG: Gfo/Idh/MocA family oxidoreductase [Bacteroidetes bacterium]|jgi:predicted dehydrogenase|nr:Gfo/Idh/MocA family oxidoreductase [Bacteroidota bacterium]MBT3751457.1 Gfo/Idh/MocA family oxidoreductase [Bacteroidota bacterium]MBT4399894.1 Gfo/Idh/MocA family oxidoreductase [Bacteroidota bacterium]MBT4410942.1 Gfo/Idh/MocA family oxidoreductase [Bacteroidota bacterium]MBT5427399.1 Gfo/Idh/MocA family oxidoreductase [Bacteroidota bacterium]